MPSLASNPSFLFYSMTMTVLCLNMLALWAYSGVVRTRSKTTPNAEDAATVARGASVAAVEPPEVARVLRAHRNATANILPFAIVAFLYVIHGASPTATGLWCGLFTVGRIGHSFAYLGGWQPWRTVFYALSAAASGIVIVLLVRAMIAGFG